ncbi:MAG TPA: DNA recombination protein RmuC [Alphaproteobacteria bacterium]
MESILVLGVAALAVAAVLVLALRGRGPDPAVLKLAGAVDVIAAQSAAVQAHIQEQEREFTKALDERFVSVTQRLTDSLGKSAEATTKTITDLRAALGERLVKIDEAQKNLAELSTRVVGLQDILANKQARGAFGEIQLENIVQSVLPRSAYETQATLSNGRRVDCLIKLPNPPGSICVDAKFPLESYRALREAADEQRPAALRAFAAAVTVHVRDIAERYILPHETAEGALMFLPSEAVYAELHASCGEVVEKANRAKVYIVSPTTLWAVLHTLRAVLKDVRMREQAGIIQQEVGRLLDDTRRLDERVERLQTHFDQASKDVREIRISADKVIKRAVNIGDVEIEDGAPAAEVLPGPKLAAGE